MLDWDDLRFFLAIARHHTLAAAARHLHVTQSTVGRRLASLQAGMGVRLLQRTAEGYVLTLAGESIRARVEHVEAEAFSIEHAVAGHDIRPAGVVRVTSSQLVTSHLLVPGFALLHGRNRDILIESLPLLSGEPLITHDADISVRLKRFEHHDLVARNIGTLAFGLYGSVPYLARFGEADVETGCSGHQLITLLSELEISAQSAWLTEHAKYATVVLKTDSYQTQYWAAYCGGGLALLPRFRGDAEPALRRIRTPTSPPSASIWLGVHSENRETPRVRIVLDCITDAVRSRATVLDPREPVKLPE